MGGHLGRILEALGVPVTRLGSLHRLDRVGEMPRNDKRQRADRLRRKAQRLGNSTDQRLVPRGGGGRRACRTENGLLRWCR